MINCKLKNRIVLLVFVSLFVLSLSSHSRIFLIWTRHHCRFANAANYGIFIYYGITMAQYQNTIKLRFTVKKKYEIMPKQSKFFNNFDSDLLLKKTMVLRSTVKACYENIIFFLSF